MKKRRVSLLIGTILAGVAAGAHAAEPPPASLARAEPRAAAPNAVRLDARTLGAANLSGLGIEYSRQVSAGVAFDVGVAFIDGRDPGVLYDVMVRPTWDPRHRAILGLGMSVLSASGLGTVAFAGADLGYEFRAWGGPSFLFAFGPAFALNDSGRSNCTREQRGGFNILGPCFLERSSFRTGDLTLRFRVGLGFSL